MKMPYSDKKQRKIDRVLSEDYDKLPYNPRAFRVIFKIGTGYYNIVVNAKSPSSAAVLAIKDLDTWMINIKNAHLRAVIPVNEADNGGDGEKSDS